MSDYLLTSKRMKIKKVDAIEESKSLDNWASDNIDNAIGGFEKFLENIESSEKIKLFAKNIEWEIILSLFNIQFYELIQKFELPKQSDEHWNGLRGFRQEFFQLIKIDMYYEVYIWIKDHKSEENIKVFRDGLYERFLVKMNRYIYPFDFQYSTTSLNPQNDPNVISVELMEIQSKVEHGRKFSGKGFRSHEIPVFEDAIKRYKELTTEGLDVTIDSVAKSFARKKLGLINGNEPKNFANRCKRYIKSIKS